MNTPELKKRFKAYALRVINLYAALPKANTVAQIIGRQVLRSATSIGANYAEASRSRSKAEFTAKTGDSLKEIAETEYWLELLVESKTIPAKKMADLLDETQQLTAILTSINKRAKNDA
ncbi:MAG: four helix bundle protein [Kiritimatiellaeota bacterium]|nr:four helix bundle protein [Kiritimatiellota bacterium]